MEILLNLAWAALALLIVCLWLREGSRQGIDRRRQIVAIVVLVAILFPVISVSDDLMAVQSATEQDNGQRRDYLAASLAHTILPCAAILTALQFDLSAASPRFVSAPYLALLPVGHPERSAIENRPPPSV